jgi:hypothetical protein
MLILIQFTEFSLIHHQALTLKLNLERKYMNLNIPAISGETEELFCGIKPW